MIISYIVLVGKEYVLSSKYRQRSLLFPTPVGQAYTCHKELKLILSNPATDLTARLYFLDFKIEPFIFKNDDFGQGKVNLNLQYLFKTLSLY